MGLYKNIKDRVRRNTLVPTPPPDHLEGSKPQLPPPGFNGRPPEIYDLPRSSATQDSTLTIPTRPHRPPSLTLSSRISHDIPSTIPKAVPPRGNTSHADDQTSLHHISSSSHVTDSAWFIPVPILDPKVYAFEYQFGGTLGEGGFGKVVLALNLETKHEYAVKIIAIRRLRSRRETASVANEIKILRRVGQTSYPFLARPAKIHNWYWQYRGNVHLVMEYYRGGDLGRNMDKYEELENPFRFKLMIAEVILGLLALHDMGIIHHDVKPANILIDGHGHCVLTDYGGSCFMTPEKKSSWLRDRTPIFTLRYAAPEVLRDGPAGGAYGPAIDFWSLGATVFELATGEGFVDETDDNSAVYNIQHGVIDKSQMNLLLPYPDLRPFVEALLVSDSTKRLQGQEIKRHAYFADFRADDWKAIGKKERPPFRNNKQIGVNPRNTSYDYVDRPGESVLDDANEDIVNRWFVEEGVGMPHHKQSEFHRIHGKNARIGLPYQGARQMEDVRHSFPLEARSM